MACYNEWICVSEIWARLMIVFHNHRLHYGDRIPRLKLQRIKQAKKRTCFWRPNPGDLAGFISVLERSRDIQIITRFILWLGEVVHTKFWLGYINRERSRLRELHHLVVAPRCSIYAVLQSTIFALALEIDSFSIRDSSLIPLVFAPRPAHPGLFAWCWF